MKGTVASEFGRVIAKKTSEGLRKRAENGHVAGGLSFGYDNA
jgi:hypothetical protein